MKKLALLSIFLALPLMAQAPSNSVSIPVDQYQRILTYAKLGMQQEQIEGYQQQLQVAQCLKGVIAKGDELAKAVLDFKAGKSVKDAAGVTVQPMYQMAENFQAAEKACVQK